MTSEFTEMLKAVEEIMAAGLDAAATSRVVCLLGAPPLPAELIAGMRLAGETLPRGSETPLTPEQRHLQFLWECFDQLPLALMVNFAYPFRRLLAGRLFARCGPAFTCDQGVHFNLGHLIAAGENCFVNRGVLLDSQGGITLGDNVGIFEYVRIFTHSHSEASHIERAYRPVAIGSYAKIYSGATILPGVTIGEEAIVASGAVVAEDVPAGMVAAGVPARVLRPRRREGRAADDLDHIWLY